MNREEFVSEMQKDHQFNSGVYRKVLDASMKSRDWTKQSIIIMEELAELSQQVSKGARGEHDPYDLILEMADVVACLDMLMAHYEITNEELSKAITVKTMHIGKKLGAIEDKQAAEEESGQLNKVMFKRCGTETPEAPSSVKKESENNMDLMAYKFNIGDEVITVDGIKGHIDDICRCSECEKRGFYELYWKDDCGDDDYYITVYEAENGFKDYHKIGSYWFHPLDKKEPEFEYPSGIVMNRRLRVFCEDHTSCTGCPLHKEFCWGKDVLTNRLGLCKVSTADLYRMYRKMIGSKQA